MDLLNLSLSTTVIIEDDNISFFLKKIDSPYNAHYSTTLSLDLNWKKKKKKVNLTPYNIVE